MTEQPPTVDNPPANDPAPPAQTPTPQSNPPSANSGQSTQDGPLQRLEQAIAGMPEAIANALAERQPRQPAQQQPPRKTAQPAQQQQQQGSGAQSSVNQATPPAVPGKKRSFAEWWFGK